METKACAKINLTLDVLGTFDGMHLLDTVIAPVDVFDVVETEFCDDDKVRCFMDGLPAGEENSAVRAARIMMDEYNLPGAEINIEKGIPFSAGMGGSTADGVAVFRLYADMFRVKVTPSMLKRLGSDAAAMWLGMVCRVEGTGGIVTPIKTEIPYKLGLIVADGGVSTKDCYALFDTLNVKKHSYTPSFLKKSNFDVRALGNDLEQPASILNPNIKDAINRLYLAGAHKAVMTGSGSAVVGYFDKTAVLPDDVKEIKIL